MTTFDLNGRTVSVRSPDDAPLLWVIHDEIGLTGTKFGCGIGLCGACTVHVDGRATRSCITPVGAVAGAKVTTIEGLDPEGRHPVPAIKPAATLRRTLWPAPRRRLHSRPNARARKTLSYCRSESPRRVLRLQIGPQS
jgi:2Fe-2S iron-sulfur cluster binding domain